MSPRLPTDDPIDHLLALDLGGRGIAGFFTAGAAARAAAALRRARRVLVVVGFNFGPDTTETDGPPGAAVLGRALRTLGAHVRYVVDAPVVAPLAATLAALDEPADILVSQGGDPAARVLLAAERPTHLVAIERPGRTRAGAYLSARGQSVAAWNAPLDALFLRHGPGSRRQRRAGERAQRHPSVGRRSRGPATVAVGDGGNEIGMGNARARLARSPLALIASVVPVDHLVVAGTSNWGAYGIVAALGRLARRPLLHAAADERRMVEACAAAGAIDGLTRRREATVDGLPLEAHAAFVELLRIAAAGGV